MLLKAFSNTAAVVVMILSSTAFAQGQNGMEGDYQLVGRQCASGQAPQDHFQSGKGNIDVVFSISQTKLTMLWRFDLTSEEGNQKTTCYAEAEYFYSAQNSRLQLNPSRATTDCAQGNTQAFKKASDSSIFQVVGNRLTITSKVGSFGNNFCSQSDRTVMVFEKANE